MVKPGDTGGTCPRCERQDLILVGYGSVVLGVFCELCDILIPIAVETMTAEEAEESEWVERDGMWGPDAWG